MELSIIAKKINSLLIGRNSALSVQLMRYIVVGSAAFFVDFIALFLLTEYGGVHYLVSAAIGFIIGLAVNYTGSVGWVFSNRSLSNRSAEISLFALIGIIGLGLNELGIWLLTEQFAIHYLISKIVVAMLVFLWNFFGRKYLLFR